MDETQDVSSLPGSFACNIKHMAYLSFVIQFTPKSQEKWYKLQVVDSIESRNLPLHLVYLKL